jgi:uncharacterized protein (DUF1015 family)
MAKIYPFKGVRYNTEKNQNLSKILTQPYDKIDEKLQDDYYNRSPYNYARIIKGKDEPGDNDNSNKYTRAAEYLKKWMDEGIIIRDNKPAIYAYSQEINFPGYEKRTRWAFITVAKIEDYGEGGIKPHEKTLDKPKIDRFMLTKAVMAQTGLIFMLYSDPQCNIDQVLKSYHRKTPIIEIKDDFDIINRVWKITDPMDIETITRVMGPKDLFIADGHHRYETSINIRNEMRQTGRKFEGAETPENCLMAFVNMDGTGLIVLPTHRLVRNLHNFSLSEHIKNAEKYFKIEKFPYGSIQERAEQLKKLENNMKNSNEKDHVFGLYAKNESCLYTLTLLDLKYMDELLGDEHSKTWKSLDVSILHTMILDKLLGIDKERLAKESNVAYVRNIDEGLKKVDEEDFQILYILNPTKIQQVKEIADARETLPQKSTDFFPKMLSGIVLNKFIEK